MPSVDPPPAGTTRILRLANSRRCLRTLRDRGPLSRADLSRELGLTRTTAGNVIGDLLEAGLVREVPRTDEALQRGRPGTAIGVDPSGAYFFGVEIDVHHIAVTLVDLSLGVVEAVRETPGMADGTVAGVIGRVVSLIEKIAASWRVRNIHGVGVSFSGIVTPDGNAINPTLPHWNRLALTQLLRERLPRDWAVACCNDAAAIAHALVQRLPERDKQNLLVLFLSGGIGSVRVRHGEIDRGANGAAGELGLIHMGSRLTDGSGMFHRHAGFRHFAEFIGSTDDPASSLAGLASRLATDPALSAAAADWVDALAAGLLNAILMLDPELILVTGPLAVLYDGVADEVRDMLQTHYIPGLSIPRIVTVAADQRLPAIGAAAMVREDLFALPALEMSA